MAELWKNFTEQLGSLAGKWTAYAAFGSFLLYLLGYLTLRFQLSMYGVATNLDVFDEKYVFAGCRFVVYLVSSVPNFLIIVLTLAAVGYLPYRLVPISVKARLKRIVSDWCSTPLHRPLLGVVVGVAFIQFVLRKCFAFGNVLLGKELPSEWITSVLLGSDGMLSLYFCGLVAGTLLTAAILLHILHSETATTSMSQFLVGVLVFLVAVEFLLLPVNYGVLISTQQLPRMAAIGGDEKTSGNQSEWLLWDTKDAVTYFVRDSKDQRMLVTIPRKDARIGVVAYDDIFCVLFAAKHTGPRPCPR